MLKVRYVLDRGSERMSHLWKKIVKFFKDSETIFWARLQIFLGLLSEVLIYADFLTPFISIRYLPLWLIVSGILTEYLRRRRADDL